MGTRIASAHNVRVNVSTCTRQVAARSRLSERLHSLFMLPAAALLLLLTSACTTTAPPPLDAGNDDDNYIDAYQIGIGDALNVNVYRQEDLSAEVTVRPDGKITVPVVGELFVGSKTPEEVSAVITEALSKYVRDPLVTVTVVGIGNEYSSRVRVTGAVANPQTTPYRTGMTVLDVVLESGGVTEFAAPSKTVIYRKGQEKIRVRLDKILKTGDLSTNIELKPGDIITVPERIF